MKRDPVGILALGGLVAIAVALAGITRTPDAAWVQALTRAAVIGPWVDRFAELYRRPPPASPGESGAGGTVEREIVYELDLERYEARPRVWVEGGTAVLESASVEAPRVGTVETTTNLRIFERRDDWYLVRFGDRKGWVLLPGYWETESRPPPLGSEPDPVLPVPSRSPDEELVAEAVAQLGRAPDLARIGPYALYTDVDDEELLADLSEIARGLEAAYSERYGVTPIPGADEAVVLYASREAYRSFQASSPEVGEFEAPGLVRSGVVATYRGDRSPFEIAGTIVHELTHLLNRRSIGPALPPWLDEGLADDMGQSQIEGGRVQPGRVGGSYVRRGTRTEFKGGRAAAIELQRALGGEGLPSVETLVGMDWNEFQSSDRSLHYAHASFFVRSLLDSPDAELAGGFRAFLGDVSRGRAIEPEALRARLGRSWSELDRRLESFVRLQAVDVWPAGESDSSSRQAAEPSS